MYVYLNVVLSGVEFLILLTSTAVLDLKFIISQLKKEMFPPWLIAVTWLNSWNNVSVLDTGRFYSKYGVSAGHNEGVMFEGGKGESKMSRLCFIPPLEYVKLLL